MQATESGHAVMLIIELPLIRDDCACTIACCWQIRVIEPIHLLPIIRKNVMAAFTYGQHGVRSPSLELKSRSERSELPCYKDSRAAVRAHIVMLNMATKLYA